MALNPNGTKKDAGGSIYNYSNVPGSNSIGNWNTGGSYVGTGNAGGVYNGGMKVGGSPNFGGAESKMIAQALARGTGAYPGTAGPINRYIQQTSIPDLPGAFKLPSGYVPNSGLPSFYGNSARGAYNQFEGGRIPGTYPTGPIVSRNPWNAAYQGNSMGYYGTRMLNNPSINGPVYRGGSQGGGFAGGAGGSVNGNFNGGGGWTSPNTYGGVGGARLW